MSGVNGAERSFPGALLTDTWDFDWKFANAGSADDRRQSLIQGSAALNVQGSPHCIPFHVL